MSDKTIENKETCSVYCTCKKLRKSEEKCKQVHSIENHHIVTMMEHELRVDGHHLIEKKEKTQIDGNNKPCHVVHIRSIDGETLKVMEISNCHALKMRKDDPLLHQVESDMTEDEVKKFEEDWTNLWNPDITKKDIEKLHQ